MPFRFAPAYLLVAPHRHVANWSELHASERTARDHRSNRAGQTVATRDAPCGRLQCRLQRRRAAAGQTPVPHRHLHIIPRRDGDAEDRRRALRDLSKGNYLRDSANVEPKTLTPLAPRDAAQSSAAVAGRRGCADPPPAPARRYARGSGRRGHIVRHGERRTLVRVPICRTCSTLAGGSIRLVTGDYLTTGHRSLCA